MTDAGRDHHDATKGPGAAASMPSPTAAVFTVVLLAGLGAAGAAYGLGDLLGLGVGAVLAVAGALVAAYISTKSAPPDVKAIALLEAVTAENAPVTPPSRFRGEPWASLYSHAVGNIEAQKTATLAVQEVETLRRELEAKAGAPAPAAFVPSPSHEEEDLVGVAEPSYGPADALRELEEALHPIQHELAAIERDLEPVVASLRADGAPGVSGRDSTAAKMVDALVQTAADGIEDLAAGLMRASELAGVAERVTNRATLLALNAALEATRSGSEAFASIAEETRRLAEYAREATDTISRLSSEIEMKVGETISSIQSSSEDAKAAVSSLGGGSGAPSRAVAPETVTALQTLLTRVRTLRERTSVPRESPVAMQDAATAPDDAVAPHDDSAAPPDDSEAADVQVTYREADERPVVPPLTTGAPPSELPPPFGSAAFGESEAMPSDTEPSSSAEPSPIELATFEPPPAEAAESAGAEAPAPSGDAPHTVSDPASLVLPKIPDWLEGIEPRRRD